jgi:hypothetical protein
MAGETARPPKVPDGIGVVLRILHPRKKIAESLRAISLATSDSVM